MRIKLKNTPEQIELIKALGSKNRLVAAEASEAFAAFLTSNPKSHLASRHSVSDLYRRTV